MVEINGYSFENYNGLFWYNGDFWYNDVKCIKVYNNGTLSIKVNNTKLGLKKLRRNAKKCKIKINSIVTPF